MTTTDQIEDVTAPYSAVIANSGKIWEDIDEAAATVQAVVQSSIVVPPASTYVHHATDVTVVQTSNSSPLIVSADSEHSTPYSAWKAFDHTVVGWASTKAASQGPWLEVDFGLGTEKIITACTLTAWDGGNSVRTGGTYKIQGSNGVWSDLKSVTEVVYDTGEMRLKTWTNTTAYRYYRIIWSAIDNDYEIFLAEWELFESLDVFTVKTFTLT